jgi:hypothetical protein
MPRIMNILKLSRALKNSSEDIKVPAVKRLATLGVKNIFSNFFDNVFEK